MDYLNFLKRVTEEIWGSYGGENAKCELMDCDTNIS